MGTPVDFPFHRDREHLPAEDRQQISSREKTKPARAERGIWIMSRRRWNYRTANFRTLTDRRLVFVRHTRARRFALEHACEILKLRLLAATRRREPCLGSARASRAGDRALAIANFLHSDRSFNASTRLKAQIETGPEREL